MKDTGVCPKCRSTDIGVFRRRMWATMIPIHRTVFGAVYTSWYLCASCGFVESWIEAAKDLEKVRKVLSPRGA